jgi:hypothetical protein
LYVELVADLFFPIRQGAIKARHNTCSSLNAKNGRDCSSYNAILQETLLIKHHILQYTLRRTRIPPSTKQTTGNSVTKLQLIIELVIRDLLFFQIILPVLTPAVNLHHGTQHGHAFAEGKRPAVQPFEVRAKGEVASFDVVGATAMGGVDGFRNQPPVNVRVP